ncbi:MAG: ATP-binding cassette domain-containing protein [Phycisphaerae bacterium]
MPRTTTAKPRRSAAQHSVPAPTPRAAENGAVKWLVVRDAAHNNLAHVDVAFPLGRFTCVTGVSGSGKSSLLNDVLYPALARRLNNAYTAEPGAHGGIDGIEQLDKIIEIDQSPIGRTPRSNPATYIKVFDEIRDLFAKLPDAKLRGYKSGRFSFNVSAGPRGGGRCEACEGNGSNRIEMDFLADVWVTCPVCGGKRFSRETLQIQYKHKSISDVLEMDVQEAIAHFENVPRIRDMLQTLHDVGLDYIKIGQPSNTLSGGEAQRIKLARELVKKATGRTIYVLDEPTTGLHFEDIRKLLAVLHSFVDAGNTVIVIEHNLDVIKTADWVIDLGPEGGAAGGRIVVEGTPEFVAACKESHTGVALREVLGQSVELLRAKSELKPSRIETTRFDRPAGDDSSSFALRNSQFALDSIVVRGARQHNLKDVTVAVPRDRVTVCTGVSGSGKTSFAIDTVFTEGYRRYVESLSAYARQFLGQLQKPRVDHVEGLSPAICIEQKAASKSPRSTVGTITEIYDYMRVLWARVGTPYCPRCQIPIGSQTADEIVDRVLALQVGSPLTIVAPVSLGDGENYGQLFTRLKNSGYTRVRIDGAIQPSAQATTLDARRRHRVEVVVDRLVLKPSARSRIAESVEHALSLGDGVMVLVVEPLEIAEHSEEGSPGVSPTGGTGGAESSGPRTTPREIRFSQNFACTRCGESYEPLSPHHFSFNSQTGWCETCEGLGVQRGAPAAAIIKHPGRSILDGAIAGWWRIDPGSPFAGMISALCRALGVEAKTPLNKWSAAQRNALMFGVDTWIEGQMNPRGVAGERGEFRFQWRGFFPTIDAATRHSREMARKLHDTVTDIPCVSCRGGRLRPDAAAVRLTPKAEGQRPNAEGQPMNAEGPRSNAEGRRANESSRDRKGAGEGIDAAFSTSPLPDGRGSDRLYDAELGPTLVDVCQWPLSRVAEYFAGLKLSRAQLRVAGELLHEISNRVQFLVDVGLEYLTLHRAAPTLSGGEAQRIRLASQIGSGLSGVLYVLDEPTIGLHPRDTQRLISAIQKLKRLGNTLLLVEHDRDVIRTADNVLDFGPRAGAYGGEIVASGPPAELFDPAHAPSEPGAVVPGVAGPTSLTRDYLGGQRAVPIPINRRVVVPWVAPPDSAENAGKKAARATRATRARAVVGPRRGGAGQPREDELRWLVTRGARQHNLKNIDVPIPLGRLVCLAGVSGSGKSSLVNDILWPALARKFYVSNAPVGEHDALLGGEHLVAVINVDQAPIGTTPSSNPATYTGVFDWIRELFARLPDSKLRGYNANRFSFNRPGGRCEACEGYGQKRIEMHFMPDVWIECETCGGKRYERETLDIRFKGKNIADVLDMRIAEALELFANVPRIRRMLQTLADVGLDYVQLGQPAPTLSGGEAQRVKLATELGKPDTGQTLYILDEPTTGLHFEDVRKLLDVLQRLVDLGNSVLVVEHNLDVIKCADWIIELGPEAGDGGGYVVAAGTPEEVVKANGECRTKNAERAVSGAAEAPKLPSAFCILHSAFTSHTAYALAPILAAGPYAERPIYDAARHAAQVEADERVGLGKIGREVRMPWQIDGRKWHLEQRTSRDGSPLRWERAAMLLIEELVQEAGGFAPTAWSDRAHVEISAPDTDVWFMHVLTGGEWLLECYFRVPRGTFSERALTRQIGLKTLDQREDLQTYGDWPRVALRERLGPLDAVAVYVHDRAEIDTPGFRKFVRDAARAYLKSIDADRGRTGFRSVARPAHDSQS